jgi:pimeloyl-ACP methyl ester carboxylesterase
MAWVELMKRLGYTQFAATGGDWGALITDIMGVQAAPELIGIHTNMAGAVPPALEGAAVMGAPAPADLSAEETRVYERVSFVYSHVGYAHVLGSRPQTLTGFADSPVGLAAFLLDHDVWSYEHLSSLFVDGTPFGAITRDDILDNITLFWLTHTEVSSGRVYWENKYGFFGAKGVSVPVAVSVFPEELYQPPRHWAEQAYPNLIHYNRLDQGGHFAAWEQPQLLSEEIRTGLRSLRK